MTASELFNTALELAGYSEKELLGSSDIGTKIVSIVNTVYADIYFSANKTGFEGISNADDELALDDDALYDCAVYGVAALIQNILGSYEDFEVFDKIYKHKKKRISRKCEVKQIKDTFARGSDF